MANHGESGPIMATGFSHTAATHKKNFYQVAKDRLDQVGAFQWKYSKKYLNFNFIDSCGSLTYPSLPNIQRLAPHFSVK